MPLLWLLQVEARSAVPPLAQALIETLHSLSRTRASPGMRRRSAGPRFKRVLMEPCAVETVATSEIITKLTALAGKL